ncbi:rhamnogalacturonan acetylesterase [Catenovulum sediminis]|uniref:rhamnogalacturonan acetylesterase n=1 Tax=Catenovulum sediminis TaxID=1740262 RepID=UPI00117CDF15|nr:rhamnogalacturonan acetylesterase [Catenovulum sediminis]
MQKNIINKILICLLLCTHWVCAEETELMPKTIFIAGDSTAARYNKEDQQGWGGVFESYFNLTKVKIDNRARGGRSSRTFITEGLWQQLLNDVQAGDLVLIQFGHNDASPVNDARRARGTLAGIKEEFVDIQNKLTGQQERVYTFGHYIRQMVSDVREKNATPVLMSLTVRNKWYGHRIERGSGKYGYWMYQLAWELNTAYLDVTNAVADKLETLGAAQTAAFYPKDHTHFNHMGAHIHAQSVVAVLKGIKPKLNKSYFSERGLTIESYDWTWLRLPVVADQSLRSVFMVGDSTVRNGAGDGANLEWGWGSLLGEFVDTNKVNLVNRAIGGLSSRTFVTGGHWQRALNMMKPGDFVLIQFGHNDAAALNDNHRARGTINGIGVEYEEINNMLTKQQEKVLSYGGYLRKMIGEALAFGVKPIIVTPVPRKIWQKDTAQIKLDNERYPLWAKQVARQSGTTLIDLHNQVAQEYNQLGQLKVDKLFADKHTHTSYEGARLSASLVAAELQYILAH